MAMDSSQLYDFLVSENGLPSKITYLKGSGVPTITPSIVPSYYLDEDSEIMYCYNGTTKGWKEVGSGTGGGTTTGGSGVVEQTFEEDITLGTPVQFGTTGVKKLTTTITGTSSSIASTGATYTYTSDTNNYAETSSVLLNDGVSIITNCEYSGSNIGGYIKYGVMDNTSASGVIWYDSIQLDTTMTAGYIITSTIVPIFSNGFVVVYPFVSTTTSAFIGSTAQYLKCEYFEINPTTKKIVRGTSQTVTLGGAYNVSDLTACVTKGYDNVIFVGYSYYNTNLTFDPFHIIVNTSTKAMTFARTTTTLTTSIPYATFGQYLNSKLSSCTSGKTGEILVTSGYSTDQLHTKLYYWNGSNFACAATHALEAIAAQYPTCRIMTTSDGNYIAFVQCKNGYLYCYKYTTVANGASSTLTYNGSYANPILTNWHSDNNTTTAPISVYGAYELIKISNDNALLFGHDNTGVFKFVIFNYTAKTLTASSTTFDFAADLAAGYSYCSRKLVVFNSNTGSGLIIKPNGGFSSWCKLQTKKFQMGNSTTVNWIGTCGIAMETKTSGNTGNVGMNGALITLSGLTKGAYYFIDSNTGSLTTTPFPCMIGKAISTTQLLVVNDATINGITLSPTVVNSSIQSNAWANRNAVDTSGDRVEFFTNGSSCGYFDSNGDLNLSKIPSSKPSTDYALWNNQGILQVKQPTGSTETIALTDSGWIAYTPTITGSTTAPTLATGAFSKGTLRVVGKSLYIHAAISNGGSVLSTTVGSGVYLFSIGNYTIDTTLLGTFSMTSTAGNYTPVKSAIPVGKGIIHANAVGQPCEVYAANSNTLCLYMHDATNVGLVGSGLWNGTGVFGYTFDAIIPIL